MMLLTQNCFKQIYQALKNQCARHETESRLVVYIYDSRWIFLSCCMQKVSEK